MDRQVIRRIRTMLDAIRSIHMIIGQLRIDELAGDQEKIWALERGFELISEASRGIPQETQTLYGDIPWKEIALMGNVLRHRYWAVQLVILWETALWDLPSLQSALEDMLLDGQPGSPAGQ